MINRASISYVVMLALFVLGQWAIVQFGTDLRAPPDLSGTWDLTPSPPNTVVPGKKMIISQSGRFADIRFEGGPHFSATLAEGTYLSSTTGGWSFSSKSWRLVFYSQEDSESRYFSLDGSTSFIFHGKRVAEKH